MDGGVGFERLNCFRFPCLRLAGWIAFVTQQSELKPTLRESCGFVARVCVCVFLFRARLSRVALKGNGQTTILGVLLVWHIPMCGRFCGLGMWEETEHLGKCSAGRISCFHLSVCSLHLLLGGGCRSLVWGGHKSMELCFFEPSEQMRESTRKWASRWQGISGFVS